MTDTIIRSGVQAADSVAEASAQRVEALYRDHVTYVYRYLAVRVGSPQDTQDLTAQTFLAALESLQAARKVEIGSARGWLIGIARHKAAAFYRKRPDSAPLEAANEIADPAPTLDARAMHNLRLDEVARVMRIIAPDRAEAIALCFFGGLSLDEAASVMGRSRDAVKMLVHRGIADLRQRLTSDHEED